MNTRRKFLFGSPGLITAGAAGVWFEKNRIVKSLLLLKNNEGKVVSAAPAFDGDCVLTSEAVEGPFFVRSAVRKDIRDGKQGKELNLKLKLTNAADCSPVERATVEVWHCDAEGVYSGYPEEIAHDLWGSMRFLEFNGEHKDPVTEKRFLRGAQVTDADGVCEFTTIVPGWYEGRCPHIHFKVFTNEKAAFATQFYLNEDITKRIYTSIEPYNKFGESPYNMKNDQVINLSQEHAGVLLNPVWNDSGPLSVSAKIGLKLS